MSGPVVAQHERCYLGCAPMQSWNEFDFGFVVEGLCDQLMGAMFPGVAPVRFLGIGVG